MRLPKLFLALILFLCASPCFAQQTLYAASKSGLNLREQANASSPVIAKIPYGSKVSLIDENYTDELLTEGMKTYWTRIRYEGHTGYAAHVYLLPFMPPSSKFNGYDMAAYLESLSKLQGSSRKVISYSWEGQPSVSRNLYENGMAQRSYQGYEEVSETAWIPGISLEQGFVLARLLCGLPELLSITDGFPAKPYTAKGDERSIKIWYLGERPMMLRYEVCTTACYVLEIRMEEAEVSIMFSSAL